ncbi:MAG: hypothetical protein M3357_18030, partial [Actinomycetota bacterium]|nr:hypothetical protein [Actinomycetota bacterium]
MLARVIQSLRSRPGRTAALALVLLLALGAAVAGLSDGTGTVQRDEAGRQVSAGDSAVAAEAPMAAILGEAKSGAGGGSAPGRTEAGGNYDRAAPAPSAAPGSPVNGPGGLG